MPYIEQKLRAQLEVRKPAIAGERSYLACKIINDYINQHGRSYAVFDNVMQALEELTRFDLYPLQLDGLADKIFNEVFEGDKTLVASHLGTIRYVEIELSNRLIVPYEQYKLCTNGDVFTSDPKKS